MDTNMQAGMSGEIATMGDDISAEAEPEQDSGADTSAAETSDQTGEQSAGAQGQPAPVKGASPAELRIAELTRELEATKQTAAAREAEATHASETLRALFGSAASGQTNPAANKPAAANGAGQTAPATSNGTPDPLANFSPEQQADMKFLSPYVNHLAGEIMRGPYAELQAHHGMVADAIDRQNFIIDTLIDAIGQANKASAEGKPFSFNVDLGQLGDIDKTRQAAYQQYGVVLSRRDVAKYLRGANPAAITAKANEQAAAALKKQQTQNKGFQVETGGGFRTPISAGPTDAAKDPKAFKKQFGNVVI